jgi:hypothetical protein
MRRPAKRLFALLSLALLALPGAAMAPARGGPPHAWLFGTWTGGLFPVTGPLTAEACLAQPTVIFTRDVVLRAMLTDVTFAQRVVATARTNPGVTDFLFAPGVDPAAATSSGLLGLEAPKAAQGFGCESPDVLHVLRRTDNEITFPGCGDFPNPLIRCPAR